MAADEDENKADQRRGRGRAGEEDEDEGAAACAGETRMRARLAQPKTWTRVLLCTRHEDEVEGGWIEWRGREPPHVLEPRTRASHARWSRG